MDTTTTNERAWREGVRRAVEAAMQDTKERNRFLVQASGGDPVVVRELRRIEEHYAWAYHAICESTCERAA